MKGFSLKRYVLENFLSLTLLITAFGLCCYFAMQHNPDSDALFLIENGRWIVKNGGVPKINPWNITEGMGIIVQQWICSILNYEAYKLLGFRWMWIAAILMNICLIASMGWLCRAFCKKSHINLLAMAITEFFCCSFITTRPYQITMTTSFLMLGMLFRRNKTYLTLTSKIEKIKHILITTLFCSLFALFQANYQLAFFFMLFAWPLCFVAPKWNEIWRKDVLKVNGKKEIWEYWKPMVFGVLERSLALCVIYAGMFLAGLCNPYGLSGLLYLPKSSKAIGVMTGKIGEITSQNLCSIFGLAIVALLILIAIILKEIPIRPELFQTEVFYLTAGTLFLAIGTVRNTWLIFPSFLILFVTYVSNVPCVISKAFSFLEGINGKKVKRISIEFTIAIAIMAPFILPRKSMDEYQESIFHAKAVSYMMNLDKDYKLYTTFNTGAMFEFCGIKVYFDPRPEIYASEITGGINQFDEWYKMEYEDPETLVPFLQENNFTHCEVSVNGILDYLLRHNSDFTEIDRSDYFVLYEKVGF